MSVTPAVIDTDFRASAPRPAEESRPSQEAKFQDAVDSRRAERARAASKAEVRDSQERVSEREDVSEHSDDRRSDAVGESETDASEDTESSPHEKRFSSRESSASRNEVGEPPASREDASARLATRAARDASRIGSTERRSEAGQTGLAIPWFGQAALESILATALAHGHLPGTSSIATGSAPASVPPGLPGSTPAGLPVISNSPSASTHVASQTAGLAEQPVAALKAATAAAIETDALGALPHRARDVESPARVLDPRGAVPAFAALHTTELADARAPVAVRLTPAELPAFLDRLAVSIDTPERSALVHLEPPDLGPLSISLSLEPGGHVRADMHAQRPDGYAALEARLPDLHKSLMERGFTSASVNLSLGHSDPNSHRSGARDEHSKSTSAGRRTLADAEVRAMLPASLGAIDMWA